MNGTYGVSEAEAYDEALDESDEAYDEADDEAYVEARRGGKGAMREGAVTSLEGLFDPDRLSETHVPGGFTAFGPESKLYNRQCSVTRVSM